MEQDGHHVSIYAGLRHPPVTMELVSIGRLGEYFLVNSKKLVEEQD